MLVLLIASIVMRFGNFFQTNKEIYEATWGIKFPAQLTQIYSKKTPADFQGKNVIYTIYDEKKVKEAKFDGEDKLDSSQEERINFFLEQLSLSPENKPDFKDKLSYLILSYFVKERNGDRYLFVISDHKLGRLYVLQGEI